MFLFLQNYKEFNLAKKKRTLIQNMEYKNFNSYIIFINKINHNCVKNMANGYSKKCLKAKLKLLESVI